MSMFIPNIISLHLSPCKAYLCFCVLRLRHSAVSNSATLWTLAIRATLWTPASSIQGIFQVRIMEWVAISSSMGSSWPRYWTRIFCINRWILYHWTIWEAVIANPVYSISMWNELAYTNKKDGSWWRVLTKRGPLEKGVANHFSILPWEPHEQHEKAKR